MEKERFESLANKYSPLIKNLIDSNVRFYSFNQTIKWQFGYDDDISIVAVCNKETNIITINIKAVENADIKQNIKEIEYYLLHEIRHIFQHLMIADYNSGIQTPIPFEIIKNWIDEEAHYIKALDKNGIENPGYALQDIEKDAYAFSYAVMKYKYGEVNVYIPEIYGKEFNDIVDEWLTTFKEEKIPKK